MPDYDFLSLSPTDFERLVCDVLNVALGTHMRWYPEGRDRGIDLREVTPDQRTIIGQCKHYARTGAAKFVKAVEGETNKLGYKIADRYLFATSHQMSADLEAKIAKILKIPIGDVWGPGAINDILGRNPEVERRHFKLWLSSTTMLDSIVNAGLWNRTDSFLEEIAQEAKFWVETPAYPRARAILDQEGVCIITGLPGTGKTFLAERLALDRASRDWSVIKIVNPRDAWDVWNTDKEQFFYYDDFLGQARLALTAVDEAPELIKLISRVRSQRSKKQLVMTSREQIMREAALAASDPLNDLDIDPARCAIVLSDLDMATRIELLTAHLYFSELPDDEYQRAVADRRLLSLAKSPSYSPRIIREIARRIRAVANADQVLADVEQTFNNPQRLWRTSFEGLLRPAQEILTTLATLPVRPIYLAELRALVEPMDTWGWQRALKSLEPAWIRIVETDNERTAVFSNPGCRDYMLSRLDDPEHASELVDRLQRLDQVITLGHEAGMLTNDTKIAPAIRRNEMARALTARRTTIASRVEYWYEEWDRSPRTTEARLSKLRDAAILLAKFGQPESNGWLLKHLITLTQTGNPEEEALRLPVMETMALARRLSDVAVETEDVRGDLLHTIITAALMTAKTSRDLDAYENIPEDLRTNEVHAVARRCAIRIIDDELEQFILTCEDPDELLESGEELRIRALWYGHEITLGDLYDRAAELGNTRDHAE